MHLNPSDLGGRTGPESEGVGFQTAFGEMILPAACRLQLCEPDQPLGLLANFGNLIAQGCSLSPLLSPLLPSPSFLFFFGLSF